MELLAAVNEFASGKPDHAPVVMERLRAFLWRYLATYARDSADREDIIAEVHARLWGRKGKLEFPTLGAFWAYTAKTARSIALNRIRTEIPTESFDEQLSADDIEFVDTIADAAEDRDQLYALADELWLGVEPSGRHGRAPLVAAQLFYIHGQSVREIAELLLGPTLANARIVTEWLQNESLLLQLCYREAYFDNDRLSAHLLDPGDPPAPSALDELSRVLNEEEEQSQFPGLSSREVRIILLRFRNGLLTEKILQLVPSATKDDLQSLFDRCGLRTPFNSIATRLKATMIANGAKTEPLKNPGLYKRLVFQYHAADELPQRQILERAGPVAIVGPYNLTEAMLNVWLSNGRLFTQLATYARENR